MRSAHLFITSLLLLFCFGAIADADEPARPYADGKPPKDAVILFDGNSQEAFTRDDGKEPAWKLADGELIITEGGGNLVSKHQFASAHMHIEFNLPDDPKQKGNSGVYIHKLYEVQIIDSFNKNPYKPAQQCASIYTLSPPSKNVCKKPGEWQTLDIQFIAPRLDKDGKLESPARISVWHNGVEVQKDVEVKDGTGGAKGKPIVAKGPMLLQNHGSAVRFRNLWIRELP
ncbi:MAG: DUF1080 domain-containing protein [Phycisphaeraceae bacterium]